MFRKIVQKQFLGIIIFILALKAGGQNLDAKSKAEDFSSLCNAGIEGTFEGAIEKVPTSFNIICIDDSRMAMGINYGPTGEGSPLTLINSLLDGDGTIVFSLSPLDQADRRAATSGSPESYVRIDIKALKKGILNGVFLGGNSVRPQNLAAHKKIVLPSLSSLKSIGVDPKSVRGTYSFSLSNKLKLSFWFDMVGGVPVVTIFDGNKGLHLIDGPRWDGKSGFAVTDAFGDYMPVSRDNLIQMRGYVSKLGELEIYYVDPINGVQGPLRAVRQ